MTNTLNTPPTHHEHERSLDKSELTDNENHAVTSETMSTLTSDLSKPLLVQEPSQTNKPVIDPQTGKKIRRKPRPMMRGWSHAVASFAALGVSIYFCRETAHDIPKFISILVFSITLVLLYTVSAAFHIGSPFVSKQTKLKLQALDHVNIFFMIAGTYTPLCFNVLLEPQRSIFLTVVWACAFFGVFITVTGLKFSMPRYIGACLYVGMGWIALFVLPTLADLLGIGALLNLALGGVFYTTGAVIYSLRWPNPFPHYFGFHEVFHVFVILGGSSFAYMIWKYIILEPVTFVETTSRLLHDLSVN